MLTFFHCTLGWLWYSRISNIAHGCSKKTYPSRYLPPATKLGQGNIFRSLCQEFCSHPGAVHVGRYGQQAGGTHPTGMHTCLNLFLVKYLSFRITHPMSSWGTFVMKNGIAPCFLSTWNRKFALIFVPLQFNRGFSKYTKLAWSAFSYY